MIPALVTGGLGFGPRPAMLVTLGFNTGSISLGTPAGESGLSGLTGLSALIGV